MNIMIAPPANSAPETDISVVIVLCTSISPDGILTSMANYYAVGGVPMHGLSAKLSDAAAHAELADYFAPKFPIGRAGDMANIKILAMGFIDFIRTMLTDGAAIAKRAGHPPPQDPCDVTPPAIAVCIFSTRKSPDLIIIPIPLYTRTAETVDDCLDRLRTRGEITAIIDSARTEILERPPNFGDPALSLISMTAFGMHSFLTTSLGCTTDVQLILNKHRN